MTYRYLVTIAEKGYTWNKFEFVFGTIVKAMDFAESILMNFNRPEDDHDHEIIVTIKMNTIVLESEVKSNDVISD